MLKRITSLILFLTYFISNACICDGKAFETEVKEADEIFIGRLIEVKEINYDIQNFDIEEKIDAELKSTRLWYAKFEVEKKWKGSNRKFIEIYRLGTGCGINFMLGFKRALIFAKKGKILGYEDQYDKDEVFHISSCFRSTEFTYHIKSEDEEIKQENKDFHLLDKKFPNTIELVDNTIFHWKLPLIGVLIFVIGLFIGLKLKK